MSPYVYCHNNPVIRIDPNGKFDFVGINNNQYDPVIAVFPINEVTPNNQIKTDYDAALNSGMPIMLVENINDFADAMSHLKGIFSYTDSYTLNSHGFLGNEDNATSFMIGDDRVDADTDFSVLKNGLENHIVFIGARIRGTEKLTHNLLQPSTNQYINIFLTGGVIGTIDFSFICRQNHNYTPRLSNNYKNLGT